MAFFSFLPTGNYNAKHSMETCQEALKFSFFHGTELLVQFASILSFK